MACTHIHAIALAGVATLFCGDVQAKIGTPHHQIAPPSYTAQTPQYLSTPRYQHVGHYDQHTQLGLVPVRKPAVRNGFQGGPRIQDMTTRERQGLSFGVGSAGLATIATEVASYAPMPRYSSTYQQAQQPSSEPRRQRASFSAPTPPSALSRAASLGKRLFHVLALGTTLYQVVTMFDDVDTSTYRPPVLPR